MSNRHQIILVFLFLTAGIIPLHGQNKFNKVSLSSNEFVRSGRLENGLTYYIKPISNPSPQVQLDLIVKAGSYLQDKDQVSMAHFLEHMAFKASKNFPNGLQNDVKSLNHIGMSKFDLKGHSGTRATEFIFKAPRGNSKAIDAGLLWFKDIVNGDLELKKKDINKERGIYKQEYIIRGGDNFQKFLNDNQLRHKLFYKTEDMTGFFEHIETFDPEVLRCYYKDWYHPAMMAVIVVGNIKSLDSIEAKIKKTFSRIPKQRETRKIINIDSIFYNQPPQFALLKQKAKSDEVSEEAVQFTFYFRDHKTSKALTKLDGTKRLFKWIVLVDILNNRLIEKSKGYNKNFDIRISHTFQKAITPPSLKVSLNSGVPNHMEIIGLTFSSLKQLHEYGVSKKELKKSIEKLLQQQNVESPQNINYWQSQIKQNFLYGVPLLENKWELIKTWVSDYSLQDFNEFIRKNDLSFPDDIGIIAPSNHLALNYTEETIRSKIIETYQRNTEPFSEPESPNYLITPAESKKIPNNDYSYLETGTSGTIEIKLKNGINLILKSFEPNGVNNNKILVHGFTPIGALNFPEKDYFSAVNAPAFIKNSGVAEFDKFDLQGYLEGKSIFWHGINLYLYNLESGIKINSKKEDFEVMLQLIQLFFTEAKVTKNGFKDWKQSRKNLYQNPIGDLKHIDLNVLAKNTVGDQSGVLHGTARFNGLGETDMSKGFEIYKKVFGNLSQFTFIISGDFVIDSVLPLLNKYLGSIPNFKTNFPILNPNKKPLQLGPYYKEFPFPETYKKENIMYMPRYLLRSDITDNWKESIKVEALGAVTNTKVWNLRFDKGYSLYVTGTSGQVNNEMNQYEINTSFNCIPEELPLLKKEFRKIIQELRSKLISVDLLEQSLKRMRMLYNPYGRGNSQSTIQKNLYNHYRFGDSWIDNKNIYDFIDSLTPTDILKAAEKYYKEENFYEFLLKGG